MLQTTGTSLPDLCPGLKRLHLEALLCSHPCQATESVWYQVCDILEVSYPGSEILVALRHYHWRNYYYDSENDRYYGDKIFSAPR